MRCGVVAVRGCGMSVSVFVCDKRQWAKKGALDTGVGLHMAIEHHFAGLIGLENRKKEDRKRGGG